eukprot:CAMPEP_0115162736 /NCGR_PEP_ID=MMETSP0227-20121206/72122_1 /TAXON_ID=89957 /ORGANISM="Polarella glacialis, Strain CCMP 1383" /LENGTH=37 /DNA_ID= /DNA_START= /DNA_END= /DNA_ORIENTATION=
MSSSCSAISVARKANVDHLVLVVDDEFKPTGTAPHAD